jgi:C4-dicarboxylate-specific signal transduction histidine kinase
MRYKDLTANISALCLALAAAPALAAPEAPVGALVQSAAREAARDFPAVAVAVSGDDAGLSASAAAKPADVRKALGDVIAYSARAMARRPSRRLEISVARNGRSVDVVLRDSGPGVPVEDLLAIYGESLSPSQGSPWELLAEANRLARAAGGVLTIDSGEGVGSEYMLELPVKAGGEQQTIAAR